MNNKLIKVSIVTVTYNAAKLLEQTIDSVRYQDYSYIEYIIIDGGSTDCTVDIIERYKQHITYWISEPDRGIYHAMNKGVDSASGEWIIFMNAGDTFVDQKTVSSIIHSLENDDELVCGDLYLVDLNGRRTYTKPRGINAVYDGMFCFHQALFTRTDLMKQYRFNEHYKIAGDYDFVLKCYKNSHKFRFLDQPIALFLTGGMAESNPIVARVEEMMIALRYMSDPQMVYQTNIYARFESYKEDNNRVFSKLLNVLKTQLDERINSAKKYLLYGFGSVGEMIYARYSDQIIGVIDQNYVKLQERYPFVESLESIQKKQYDQIIISVMGREKEIMQSLYEKFGIIEDQIIIFDL